MTFLKLVSLERKITHFVKGGLSDKMAHFFGVVEHFLFVVPPYLHGTMQSCEREACYLGTLLFRQIVESSIPVHGMVPPYHARTNHVARQGGFLLSANLCGWPDKLRTSTSSTSFRHYSGPEKTDCKFRFCTTTHEILCDAASRTANGRRRRIFFWSKYVCRRIRGYKPMSSFGQLGHYNVGRATKAVIQSQKTVRRSVRHSACGNWHSKSRQTML